MQTTVLIPAYNEDQTIGSLLELLTSMEEIDEVVVVDDGSEDKTASIVSRYPARLIKKKENEGKGAALQVGIENIETDILLLMDGDLVGLTEEHIISLLQPVMNDRADMVVGVFDEGRGITDLAQAVTPRLSGQRAIKFEIIKDIRDLKDKGFGVEISINKYVKDKGRLKFVKLPELTHIMKEEKMGLVRGVLARLVMYWEIFKSFFRLRRNK